VNFYKSSNELNTISPYLFLNIIGLTVLVLVFDESIKESEGKFRIAASIINRSYLLAMSGALLAMGTILTKIFHKRATIGKLIANSK